MISFRGSFSSRAMQLAALACGACVGLSALSASAADETKAESNTPLKAVKLANSVDGKATESQQDIADELITNRMARAQAGSLNRLSFTAFVTYNGGTLQEPWSDVRPNISAAAFNPEAPQISGNFGARYRLTDQSNLSAQVGYFARRPFHRDEESPNIKDRSSIQDPFVSYSYLSKVAGFQSISSVTATLYTDNLARDIGSLYRWGLDQTFIQDFGGSNFSAGLYLYVGGNVFDRTFDAGTRGARSQADYEFGVIPFLEYVLNDTFNLRTVFNSFNYQHSRNTPMGDWRRLDYTQSSGLGISITRDIFVYPNVQFAPFNARLDRTNVGIQASINI